MNNIKEAIKNDFTEMLVNTKTSFTQNISVAGRIGRWSIIDVCTVKHTFLNNTDVYALLEHNTYGDEACGLVVCLVLDTGEWEEVAETYDGLAQALYDEDIIDKMPDWD